jgi:hypothetical protein
MARIAVAGATRDPAVRPVTGQPDRHHDHVLTDINPRAPLIEHLHACQPPRQSREMDAHAARGAPEGIKDTDTRVRDATGGHPKVRAPASFLSTVSQSQVQPTSAGHMRTPILID